jgi:hypothetical protein
MKTSDGVPSIAAPKAAEKLLEVVRTYVLQAAEVYLPSTRSAKGMSW